MNRSPGRAAARAEDMILSFQVRDGHVVQSGASWVYVWLAADRSDRNVLIGRIVRIGATWLHPAARASLHLSEQAPDKGADADVVAFAVPEDIDRARARDLLALALKERGHLPADAVVGSGDGSLSERLGPPATASELAFVAEMIAHLEATGRGAE